MLGGKTYPIRTDIKDKRLLIRKSSWGKKFFVFGAKYNQVVKPRRAQTMETESTETGRVIIISYPSRMNIGINLDDPRVEDRRGQSSRGTVEIISLPAGMGVLIDTSDPRVRYRR